MKLVLVFVAVLFPVIALAQATDPVWVPGSSQKVCQLIGELDHETGQPTASQTATNYGLAGNDLGSSFEHDGKLWFLFGDTNPTATFNGKPNGQSDPPRTSADNDSIGFTSGANIGPCVKLDFVRDSIGAYQSPVVLDAQGKPAITLGDFEVPIAGIDVAGRMFVIFATDDNRAMSPGGDTGFSTRSVLAVSDDDGNTYHYLYDFSAPSCAFCNGARFVNVAIGSGASSLKDGYLYFWGSGGGTGYRNSSVFLARKLATAMAQAGGMQYFTGLAKDGVTPGWSASESDAVQLFQDLDGTPPAPTNCTGELGVDYNTFLQRWVMLYNCLDKTPANPGGIYMRFAPQPWGPWGAPQTIFNGQRDRGFCHFIHRAVTPTSPVCDQAGDPGREGVGGGTYGPYFISRFTTGSAANGTSTFYYTLSTWNPYVQVIMKTTIQGAGQTAPVIGLVANAEGEAAAIAPNTWVEIKGSNLAPAGHNRIWQASDFVGNQMPAQLDGVSATVNGKPAYVYYISPAQVNILTPPDAMSGPVQVVLTDNETVSAAFTAQAEPASPSFLVFDGTNVAATHLSGSLLGPTTLYPGSSTPARPGETVVLYANGFGPTSTPVVSGSTVQSGTLSPLPAVKIGGVAATVLFAGLVAPGEFQFNVVVPASLADGDQPITATYNGLTTQPGTLIAVQAGM
ncbi:MAG TPA: DUF4185 domain-containing protein [Bryobacteraceae bacterium]|nr:DUF4185 domain-containing protein [Bryobacteraceae bacterium]